jgi:hypothetical protein
MLEKYQALAASGKKTYPNYSAAYSNQAFRDIEWQKESSGATIWDTIDVSTKRIVDEFS